MLTWPLLLSCLILCNVHGWIVRLPGPLRSTRLDSTNSLDFYGKSRVPKYATALFHPRLLNNEPDMTEEEFLYWKRSLPPGPKIGRNITAKVVVVKESGLRLSIPNTRQLLFMPVNEARFPFHPRATRNFTVGQMVTAPIIAKFEGLFVSFFSYYVGIICFFIDV